MHVYSIQYTLSLQSTNASVRYKRIHGKFISCEQKQHNVRNVQNIIFFPFPSLKLDTNRATAVTVVVMEVNVVWPTYTIQKCLNNFIGDRAFSVLTSSYFNTTKTTKIERILILFVVVELFFLDPNTLLYFLFNLFATRMWLSVQRAHKLCFLSLWCKLKYHRAAETSGNRRCCFLSVILTHTDACETVRESHALRTRFSIFLSFSLSLTLWSRRILFACYINLNTNFIGMISSLSLFLALAWRSTKHVYRCPLETTEITVSHSMSRTHNNSNNDVWNIQGPIPQFIALAVINVLNENLEMIAW